MKKIIRLFLIAIFIVAMIIPLSCNKDEPQIVGSYLEITIRGQYYNENTGETTTEEEELKAIINLYPIEDGRVNTGGTFSSPGSGGILYSSNLGFDNTEFSDGTAHVNGFISKGPMEEGATVELALIDENMNRVEIDPEFVSDIQSATDQLSEFSIDLPATDDVDIEINVNALTTLQVERMYDLIDEGMSFYDAHLQSKEEVLALIDLQSDADLIEDFEKLDIREDSESNGALLMASAMLCESSTQTKDKQSGTLLQQIIDEMIENDGEILDEGLSDTMKDVWLNTDATQLMSMLQAYLENQGHTGFNIPNPEQFMDHDGDGIINMFDFGLIEPIGQITDPPYGGFQWQDFSVPGHPELNVEYILQISSNPYFHPMKSLPPIIGIQNNSFSIDNPSGVIQPGTNYYWRVAPIINGQPRRWVASSSFIFRNPINAIEPSGDISALTGDTTPTRQFIIDNALIEGASQMRFSLGDNIFDPETSPHEIWRPFQLYQGWLLPPGNGTHTIYAEFSNTIGTYQTSFDVTLDTASEPTGTFTVNGTLSKTVYPRVIIDASNIENAFKMRFSTNGTFDTFDERWRLYQKYIVFDIPLDEFNSDDTITITGQFANSATSEPVQKEVVVSNNPYYTVRLNIEDAVGILIKVVIDWNNDSTIDQAGDITHTYSSMNAPHYIRVEQGQLIQITTMGGFGSWGTIDPDDSTTCDDISSYETSPGIYEFNVDQDMFLYATGP